MKATETTRDNDAMTLHDAAYEGDTETCKTLIEQGADVNAKDKYGDTPLHKAAVWGHTETCKLLIENGANTDDSANFFGDTPLHYAAGHNNAETCKFLIERGLNVNVKDVFGLTPMDWAEKMDSQKDAFHHDETCNFLREHGAEDKS